MQKVFLRRRSSFIPQVARAGLDTITLSGRAWWQRLCKASLQYRIIDNKGSLATVALLMIIILTTHSTILQSALSTASFSANTATTSDTEHNSFTLVTSNQSTSLSAPNITNVTLRGLFDNLGDSGRWNQLLQPALDELNRRHPDMNIELEYFEFSYPETRNQILDRLSKGETVDIISVDQIWLGEFAQRGLIQNLTQKFEEWGRISDLYEPNLDGCVYNGTLYGLWLWTDIRGMWYWKDMLQEAGVDPESLKTWEGYISAAVKLDEFFGERIIQGVHLVDLPFDPDMWYPYLWMLGGEILEPRGGHPTKDGYWFPSYNSSQGVRALEFLKQQVDAGIEPIDIWGKEYSFVTRNFSVILEGSWLPGFFTNESRLTLEQQVGFIPMFPVPNQTIQTSTMMGGWELAIPATSQHSELAWELITLMAEPEILGPFLQQYGYLPTQQTLGEGPSSGPLKESVPYFEEMISMIPYGRIRPNIPEYPEIAEHIHQAIQQVYNGSAASSPEDALDLAAARSADSLGWH
jgi:multiple sugar transport system substrate-binding protein